MVSTFILGDGIQDLQVTADGSLWVSRGDEAIFSDAIPSLKAGLSRFNLQGRLEFESDTSFERAGIPPIDHCYALNVDAGGNAWAYYYSDFSLVRVSDDTPTLIAATAPVAGAHAIAIRDDTIVLAGSYENRNSLFEWNIATGSVREFVPVFNGLEITTTRRAGRGPELFVLEDKRLFRVPRLG